MSFQKNYEKVAVGAALVAALGLAYLGWAKLGGVESDFVPGGGGAKGNDTSVKGAEELSKATSMLSIQHKWEEGETETDRKVDLFTSVPLFIKRESPTKATDPYLDAPIHAPIPNKWWMENRLDPGFADSPQRDADGDGFSNLDEFNGKTDPNNAKSFPALVNKLKFVKDESTDWLLKFSSDLGQDQYQFKYNDRKGENRTRNYIKAGDVFFTEGELANGRFKLLKVEARTEKNPSTGQEETYNWATIEDQKPNKKGTVYQVPKKMPDEKLGQYTHWDRTAVLTLEAAGHAGKEFKVEENTAFALPADGTEKKYLLKKVSADSVEVEFADANGGKKTLQIPKGGMATADK